MTRTTAVLALVLGSMAAAPAQAQGWSDFSSAFRLFPCSDGWSGCRVDGAIVQPDMVPDAEGIPNPSHSRVGWFDLKATPSFSPFAGLSEYTGELAWSGTGGDAVAAADGDGEQLVEPEPAVVNEAAVQAEMSDADREAVAESEAAAEAQAEAEAERRAAQQAADAERKRAEEAKRKEEAARRQAEEQARRQKEAEAAAAAAASQAEKDRLRKEAEAAAAAARKAEEERKRAEAESKARAEEQARKEAEAKAKAEAEAKARAEAEAKRKAEEEARKRAEAEAQRKADEEAARKRAEAEAQRKKEEEAAAAAAAAAGNDGAADVADGGAAPPPPAGGSCELEALVRLEPQAMLGKLDEATIAACEATLAAAPKMTDKGKVSRILMVNAFSKGDKATWERLVKRHLDEIDQSDPDLCYKYALHLSKKGAGRASGVIRWSDVALENRTRWTGDTYTSRVFNLYKLRAAASQSLWKSAENAHAQAPSDDTGAKVEKYRSMTKVMSREWYEYAKQAGKDTTTALQLCMSAAGTKDYCEAG